MNEEKHRAKLDAAERKIEMLKRAVGDADKQNPDLRHRVQRLVEFEVTSRESFQKVRIMEDEVQKERMQNEGLQRRCHELEELFENERKRRSVPYQLDSLHLNYSQCNIGKGQTKVPTRTIRFESAVRCAT